MQQEDWHFDREQQRKLKLDRLLKVAASCFNSKGFSGTSLKDVAYHLKITDAALYYYVKSKEELVYLCYQRAAELGAAALDRAIEEGQDPLHKLQLYIRYQIDTICGPEGPVAILSEVAALKPKHREEILKYSRHHNRRITQLIEEGGDQGLIATSNPVAASDAILGALNWIPKWFRADSKMTVEEISESFIEIFSNGLKIRRKR